jgi:hypothetical protein
VDDENIAVFPSQNKRRKISEKESVDVSKYNLFGGETKINAPVKPELKPQSKNLNTKR